MKERDVLTSLPNIGDVLAAQLRAVGVDSAERLREMGAREAWLRILAMDDSACMNRLLSLHGAEKGVPKKAVSEEEREAMRAFYRSAKQEKNKTPAGRAKKENPHADTSAG